jgi:hypothetical protein
MSNNDCLTSGDNVQFAKFCPIEPLKGLYTIVGDNVIGFTSLPQIHGWWLVD